METVGICIDTKKLSYMRQELKGARLKVYLYLLRELDQDGSAHPTRFDIEWNTQLPVNIVSQAIKELESLGLIRVVRNPVRTNAYAFTTDLISDEGR